MPRASSQDRSVVIATKTVSAEVFVFDSSNHTTPEADGEGDGGIDPDAHAECRPDLRLTGRQVHISTKAFLPLLLLRW